MSSAAASDCIRGGIRLTAPESTERQRNGNQINTTMTTCSTVLNPRQFVVPADETLTAFIELESATRAGGELS
jgi:hypothetical protein